MKMNKCAVVLIFKTVLAVAVKDAEYYKELWDKNVKENREWERPYKNMKFKNNASTDCSKEKIKYDFVIVGAGSGGSVMASRLAENKKWKILLIEAGQDETDYSMMPGAFPQMLSSDINWGYLTTPQENACFGMVNKQCDFTKGKVLGGGSSANAMLHVRGNPKDFDNWEEMGNKGWGYKKILRFFKKSENASSVDIDSKYRGDKGPLIVSYPQPLPPLLDNIIAGNKELGYQHLDYNAEEQFGISQMQINTNFGRRYSTNQAYLKRPNHSNLDIITNALVTKIYFNKKKEANAIEYINENGCYKIKAKKEFIISAGSVNTAQLLMLSGIGPKIHLESLGIESIADLPVGENMQDHITVFNVPFDTNFTLIADLDQSIQDYVDGKGFLTYTKNLEIRFQKIGDTKNNVPNVELMFNLNNAFGAGDLQKKQANYVDDLDDFLNNASPFSISYILLHPKSKGKITLKSSDPLDYPIIDPNYFSHPDDIETLYLSIKDIFKLFETKAMQAVDAKMGDIPIEECDNPDYDDRKRWYCIIRYLSYGIYHPVGTCRMGRSKKDSVVDNELKIHGFGRIRIVDASVFPAITSGHINSVVVMIAEKISLEIKKKYALLNK